MKKLTTCILVILLLLSTVSPAFASEAGYSINVTLSQPEYLYGDAFNFSGSVSNGTSGADSAAVTVKVENPSTGQRLYIDQFTTDINGAFAGGFTISEETTAGTYVLTLSALGMTRTESFTIKAPVPMITLNIGAATFRPNDTIGISGQVTLKNVPQKNVDVTLDIIDKSNGQVVVNLGTLKTSTEGKFFSSYRVPGNAVNKSFAVRAVSMGQTVESLYSVVARPVGPPVNPPGPGKPNDVTPTVPATQPVVEILDEEGIPLGAASELVGKNTAGDKTVEVTLDPAELDTAIADESSDTIIVTIEESGIKELFVIIPTKQLIAAGKAQKTIEFVSDDIEFTLEPNCLSVVTDKLAVVAFKMQNPEGLYTLAESLDMNQVSDQYAFTVYYKDTLKAIKILKPVLVGLQIAPTMVKSNQRLGMYDFDAATSKYFYVGGKALTEFPMIYAGVKESGTLSIMEFNKQFTDLPTSHWSYNQINVLVAKHVVSGIGNGQFKGERQIKRSEFISMLVNAVDMTPGTTPVALTDISGQWYTDFIEIAASKGIIPATGAFRPNDIMTRAEMASALANVIKLYEDTTEVKLDVLSQFGDAATLDASIQMDIAIVTEFELFNGIDGNFAPEKMATRAQAAVVIYELLSLLELL